MRWRLSFWLAILAFQFVYGAVVFVVTRDFYHRESVAAIPVADVSQGMPQNVPHGNPENMPDKGTILLPGSERITVEAAQRLVKVSTKGDAPVSSAGPEELSRIADQHFRDGLFQEASNEYARVLEQSPYNVDVYNNLGLTLHYIDRSQEAVEILKKGISVDSSHQRIWLTLGFVHLGLGDASAARRALTTAAELDAESQVGREAERLLSELPR